MWLNLVVFGLKSLGVFRFVERQLQRREIRQHEKTKFLLKKALAENAVLTLQCEKLRRSRDGLLTNNSDPGRVLFD